jgi:hypothetical protein
MSPRFHSRFADRGLRLLGKTHLAVALGVLTAELGHRVSFTSALSQESSGLTEACLSNWHHPLLRSPRILPLQCGKVLGLF